MKTYLSLNQLKPYYESTDQNIKALFGIYYLTNDINAAQQFYVNYYLCDALGMEKLPSFNNLLETLSNLGSQKIQVNLGKEDGHLTTNYVETNSPPKPGFSYESNSALELLIDLEDYPDLEKGQAIMVDIVNKVDAHYSNLRVKQDKLNIQEFNTEDLDHLDEHGYLIKEDFITGDMLKKAKEVLSQIAKKEVETGNAYLYGKGVGGFNYNQRIYNLLSKHSVFRDILESVWLECFWDAYFDRPTFHEKFGLSSMAAHITVPGGEDMVLHTDTAVPGPIPKEWPMRLINVVSLCDFTEDNGATYIAPGTHKLYRNPTLEDERQWDNDDKRLPVRGKAGTLYIWNGNLWHKSTSNLSSAPRDVLIISVAPSFFKEMCGEEEHLVVVPKELQENLSPRIKSLIGVGRGIKKGASYLPGYE